MKEQCLVLNKVENPYVKVEIAHYEQVLLLPKCFQKSSAAEALESVYLLGKVNPVTYYAM